MTLNNHVPFMAKSKTEKRKFIEQIFNLEIFSKMLFELRNEYNEVKRNFDIEITRMDETNQYLNTQKNHRDNFNNDQEKKINSLNETIEVHKNDLKEAEDKLSEIEALDDQPYKDKLLELENKLNESNKQKEYANHQSIEQKQIIKTNAAS
jgi:DNA repair exonuclease SbcCD ATPase subunit